MNKRSKSALLTSFLMIAAVAVIIGVLFIGNRISGFGAMITLELVLLVFVIPRIVWLDYKFKGYKPNVVSMMVPFYNGSLIMSNLYYRLTQVFIVLTIVLGLLAKFNRVFSFMPVNIYLYIVEYLKYGFFGVLIGLFIVTGLGMASVYLYYNSLSKLVFCNDEIQYGAFKVISSIVSMSNVLCSIIFIIPVVRVLGFVMLLERLNDLDASKFTFEQLEEGLYD